MFAGISFLSRVPASYHVRDASLIHCRDYAQASRQLSERASLDSPGPETGFAEFYRARVFLWRMRSSRPQYALASTAQKLACTISIVLPAISLLAWMQEC